MRRRLRWEPAPSPLPKRPYRDSAILYGVLALALPLVAWATGGSVLTGAVVGAAFFVIATSWSWSRWRKRLREEARAKEARELAP